MEAIGYVLVYLAKGSLPWQGLAGETESEKMRLAIEAHEAISAEALCERLPAEFAHYLDLVRALDFEEEPAYAEYRKMFRDLFLRNEFVYDGAPDWLTHVAMPPPLPLLRAAGLPHGSTEATEYEKSTQSFSLMARRPRQPLAFTGSLQYTNPAAMRSFRQREKIPVTVPMRNVSLFR
jgi:hypothetical protein